MSDAQVTLFDVRQQSVNGTGMRMSEKTKEKIIKKITATFEELKKLSGDDLIDVLNRVRQSLAEHSPFKTEPVDFVKWVSANDVVANDYNPNSVAPPEMELLRLSIMADGYTQPIVTNEEDGRRIVVDGFHRNRVGKECPDVQARVHGYLPIVQIRASQTDQPDRMASTVRHNRARGKHRVDAMSDIVLDLKRRNWSNEKIGRNLGMDPDEVLRLTQIGGLADMFSDREFSMAWEPNMDSAAPDTALPHDDDDDLGSEMDGAIENGD